MTGRGAVPFPVPAAVAFDYLADPRNRPQWQSTLARVEDVAGDPRVGQRWTDVIILGLRAGMETIELVRPRRWTERGTMLGFHGRLTLVFEPDGEAGCRVCFEAAVAGDRLRAPLAALATYAAQPLVPADLRRAARLLSGGPPAR